MTTQDQRRDRRRLRRARRPVRARRRGVLPRDRLPHGGQGRARRLRLDHGPHPRGQGHERAGDRQDARGEAATRSTRPATSRPPVKLRAKFPAGLIAIMHLPGFGRQAGAAALRRARRRLAGGAARSGRGRARSARSAGFGRARCEENLLRALADARGGRRRRRRAILLSRALPVAEQIAGALREHPAADRVEIAGSLRRLGDSAKDIDIIATASRPGRADRDAGRAAAGRVGRSRAARRARAWSRTRA